MPLFKRYFALMLLTMISAAGCTDHNITLNTCSVQDPVEDLAWLRQHIEAQQAFEPNWYIQQGTYEGETVFAFNLCCINCDYIIPIYNCKGERILDNLYVQGSDEPLVSDLVTIAKPENFKCTM